LSSERYNIISKIKEKTAHKGKKLQKEQLKTLVTMLSSMMFINIHMWHLYFIAKQLKKRKNNAESVQNCAKKAQIDILGKSPILRAIT